MLDCSTEPSSPGLETLVGAFVLPTSSLFPQTHGGLLPSWNVAESATALCLFLASWPMAWIPVPQQSLPSELPCSWSACCSVQLTFPAVAFDDAMFSCVTSPPSPLLSTRTGAFSFDAPSWNVRPSANASCSFFAAWPITCSPEPLWAWVAV